MKQFNLNNMFDLEAALSTVESSVANAMAFVPTQVRENVEILTAANFALVRENVESFNKYTKAFKEATKIAA